MIHLALQSEYTFQKCYGHLVQIVKQAKENNNWALGIADKNNSFAHIKFNKLCKSVGIKPIFGVRIDATDKVIKSRSKYETYNSICEFIFIAKNESGLRKIYRLINIAYDQSYYFPRLTFEQVSKISDDILVISPYLPAQGAILAHRVDYQAISPATLGYPTGSAYGGLKCPQIAIIKNEYPNIEDRKIYELLSHPRNTDIHTYNQHILSDVELLIEGVSKEAIDQTELVATQCNVEIKQASSLKYDKKLSLFNECQTGSFVRRINLNIPEYGDRLLHELKIIDEKEFSDYFLIVADMIKQAKRTMLVGPARGSSAGSLVCYLLGITEIDPIKYDLLFERFIDINRFDLPDIDTDFADHKRQNVIKYLSKKYGQNNVKAIGTVSTLKGRSAVIDVSKALDIPIADIEDFKENLIERNAGDERFNYCLQDTFETTKVGQDLLEKHKEIKAVEKLEGHARHAGKHAAGVIISNDPLWKYGGIDSKEDIIMMDKRDAESIGLLKIDILGLRNLSILEETANLAGFDYHDYYKLEPNDPKVFEIMNTRMHGIFQFEGQALQAITKNMNITCFDDIAVITSLARPGALASGGTEKYILLKNGERDPEFYSNKHQQITESTYGIIVYQEQMMAIAREIGNMSWKDVSSMRKDINKKVGEEYYEKHYKEKFLNGCEENRLEFFQSENLWNDIVASSLYSFNKSHAVSYAMISYWTGWAKTYHPLEFAAANLNHAKDDDSAIKILRDFVINDGIKYIPIDPDESEVKWTIKNGTLLGGLINLKGIGIKKAQEIVKKRRERIRFTPAIAKLLINPITPFDILFPAKHYFGSIYKNPTLINVNEQISEIKDIQNEKGEYYLIGMLKEIELKDRNSYEKLLERGGKKVDKDPFYLKLIVEDDTDQIKCSVPPFRFAEINAMEIFERAKIDKTWFAIKGSINNEKWRNISIDQILILDTKKYI